MGGNVARHRAMQIVLRLAQMLPGERTNSGLLDDQGLLSCCWASFLQDTAGGRIVPLLPAFVATSRVGAGSRALTARQRVPASSAHAGLLESRRILVAVTQDARPPFRGRRQPS